MCNNHHNKITSNNRDLQNIERQLDRRYFLKKTSLGLGAIALGSLLGAEKMFGAVGNKSTEDLILDNFNKNRLGLPHHLPKAKRIIYLFQSGGPSQMDLFDYKPKLVDMFGKELPESIIGGQRLTGMSGSQSTLPIAPSVFKFKQHGKCKAWVSDAMPYLSEVVDDLCFMKGMQTDQINHTPAITFMQTGHQFPGRPSIGSWLSYGLGSDNENLPTFITLVSKNGKGQPLKASLWGNGFLPTEHQGVQFRAGKDPVLYLSDPENYDGNDRRNMLDYLSGLNDMQNDAYGDPEIQARMSQYEMAF